MELTRSTSRGGFSVRSIFTFVLAVFSAALLLATFASPIAQAEEINASWNGDSILYDGHQYFAQHPAKAGESHGLPAGTQYYTHVETISERPSKQKAHVIYFPTGTDPPKATSASYVVYDFLPGRVFANPGQTQQIVIEPSGTGDVVETSCAIEGVGWIVCSASTWLAEGMDWLFGVISSMMAAQPLVTGDSHNDLYVAWNVMRSIANIAFIIAFLIIIYSQLTGFGVDNYGIKKLIPRLIIAALLVNLSYYVCAIALDLSNIAGYGLQDIFVQIRDNTFNIDEDTWNADVLDWRWVTGFVLSGGTIGFLGISAATAGSLSSAAFLIVPILLALLLTALFVLVVLAARQAIIVILIVVAPLAFVAYLLPNTEKWFERWRELFMTMLIFFPAFSLVFGGSQLAGGIILQNATTIVMVIFGLAVQIAPLVITPLLLKLSGGLLGKIAGIVNDPRKGLMDRTRNWAKDRSEMHRQKSLSTGGVRSINPFRIAAKNMDNGNRKVKERTEAYSQMNENRYKRSRVSGYGKTHTLSHYANLEKQRLEQVHKAEIDEKSHIRGSKMHLETVRLDDAKAHAEAMETKTSAMLNDYRAGEYNTGGNRKLANLQRSMARNVIATTAYKEHISSAQRMQTVKYAEQMKLNAIFEDGLTLAQIAGGIDKNGAQRALANAKALLSKARKETLENIKVIIEDTNPTTEEVRLLAQGISVRGLTVTQDVVAAALQMTFGGKDTKQLQEALESVDLSFAGYSAEDREELQNIAADALAANDSKPPFVTAGAISMLRQNTDYKKDPFAGAYGVSGVDDMIIAVINAKKLDAAKLSSAGKDYAEAMLRAVQAKSGQITGDAKAYLRGHLDVVLDKKRDFYAKLGDSADALKAIRRIL